MNTYETPVVPDELRPLLSDEVLAVHERFAAMDLDGLHQQEPVDVDLSKLEAGDSETRAVVLKGDPEAGVNVLALAHQQTWKPSMKIRALFHHEVNNPEGVTIVLPNNGSSNRYYSFTDEERERIDGGDLTAFYEKQVGTVEGILNRYGRVGRTILNGYSLGGLTAVGMASIGSDKLDVAKVNAIETPNPERTDKELRKAFTKGGFPGQRAAVKDANLPVLSQALRLDRLLADYARFGLADATNKDNKALKSAMANPDFNATVERALAKYDDLMIKLGHAAGSRIFSVEDVVVDNHRLHVERYSGDGEHGHATGDNVVAHALMMAA